MYPPPPPPHPSTKPSIFTRVSSSPLCSLRKQPTFLDHWFPREIASEKRAQKFRTDKYGCQYLDLGIASDCSCRVGNLLQPIRSGYWRVICMEFWRSFLRRHFVWKPVFSGSPRCEKRSARGGGSVSSLKNLVRLNNSHPLTLRPTLIGRAAGHHSCCSVDISFFNYLACVRNRCVNFKLSIVKLKKTFDVSTK